MTLPTDAKERKGTPICTGVLDYFPDALAEIARLSKVGNDQHNPGQPLHWAKEKSTDHADCILRHLVDRGTRDSDGQRHSAKVAWRALALLQMEIEAEAAGFSYADYGVKLKNIPAAPEPAEDAGWVEWHGGVYPCVRAFLRYRNGYETSAPVYAPSYRWEHRGFNDDIVAYKPV